MTRPDPQPGTTVSPDQRTALIGAARYFRACIDSGDVIDAAIELADLVLTTFGEPPARRYQRRAAPP
jgi:hypothetical protein